MNCGVILGEKVSICKDYPKNQPCVDGGHHAPEAPGFDFEELKVGEVE